MSDKTSFSCGKSLLISDVSSLHVRLRKSLQKSSTIELKAGKVSKADTAGLQLLLAISKEVSSSGGALVWKNPSQALIDAAHALGVDKELGIV